ncbi:hypothetical protein BFR57_00520 [Idiomarina sp. MD25a]|uniref:hypothetical protein n=1 Tax=Idiomarina sp. MD25a TaxID=1889913 RepID=UPI0008F7F41F|nr:hypothetical protein [Idiomarina sp. MD25a]OIM99100.1 hypothetical protein BFR57_00520 [Idiomarina sp. MD25a]
MPRKFQLYKHMWIDRQLTDFEIKGVCGSMVHDLDFERSVMPNQLVAPIKEEDFYIDVPPQAPIIKLSQRRYVDEFFEKGTLKLGTFHEYQHHPNPEIGDHEEGLVTLVVTANWGTMIGKYRTGYNYYLFCAAIGDVNPATVNSFGYDSAFEVSNPQAFARAIAAKLNARSYNFGRCIYHNGKAIIGRPRRVIDRSRISSEYADLLGISKYLIKMNKYKPQRELRFLFEMPADVHEPIMIECPEAVQFCKKL